MSLAEPLPAPTLAASPSGVAPLNAFHVGHSTGSDTVHPRQVEIIWEPIGFGARANRSAVRLPTAYSYSDLFATVQALMVGTGNTGLSQCLPTIAWPIQLHVPHQLEPPSPTAVGPDILPEPDPAFIGGTLPYQALLYEEYRQHWLGRKAPATVQPDVSERLLAEVGRLKDGWDGPGSVAPNADLRRTLAEVVALLRNYVESAQPDVDPSGGEVSLKWFSSDARAVFSITVLPDSTTLATHTSLDAPGRDWTFQPNQLSALPYVLGHVDFLNADI